MRDRGEVTREALAVGRQRWAEVGRMANPVGYLYRLGQSPVVDARWVEGGIADDEPAPSGAFGVDDDRLLPAPAAG